MIHPSQTYSLDGRSYLNPEVYLYLYEKGMLIDVTRGGLIQVAGEAAEELSLLFFTTTSRWLIQETSPDLVAVENGCFLVNVLAMHDHQAEIERKLEQPALHKTLFDSSEEVKGLNIITVEPRELDGELRMPILYTRSHGITIVPPALTTQALPYLNRLNETCWLKRYPQEEPDVPSRGSAMLAQAELYSSN